MPPRNSKPSMGAYTSSDVVPVSPFEERVHRLCSSMTASQLKLCSYILDNIDEAVFLSGHQLALQAKTSDASVTRFARFLGFESFDQLKTALQDHYHARMRLHERLRDKLAATAGADFYEATTLSEIQYLQLSTERISSADIEAGAVALSQARKVFTAADRPAWCLVDLMDYRLTRYGLDVIKIAECGRYLFERARFLQAQDVMLIFVMQQFSTSTERLLRLARERRCKIVIVTDLTLVPKAMPGEIILTAKRGPTGVSNSLLVPMAIVNALVLAVAKVRGVKTYEALDELDRLRGTDG